MIQYPKRIFSHKLIWLKYQHLLPSFPLLMLKDNSFLVFSSAKYAGLRHCFYPNVSLLEYLARLISSLIQACVLTLIQVLHSSQKYFSFMSVVWGSSCMRCLLLRESSPVTFIWPPWYKQSWSSSHTLLSFIITPTLVSSLPSPDATTTKNDHL